MPIVVTPNTLGGKPRIEGHRIGVTHIVIWHYEQHMSIDWIMRQFALTYDEVQCALDYYSEHRSEIDMLIIEDKAFIATSLAGG